MMSIHRTWRYHLRAAIQVSKNVLAVVLMCSLSLAQSPRGSSSGSGAPDASGSSGNAQNGPSSNGGPQTKGNNQSQSQPSTAAFESQMLSYAAVDQIASNIASRICQSAQTGHTIIIYDPASFANISAYEGFLANVTIVKQAYNSIHKISAKRGIKLNVDDRVELTASSSSAPTPSPMTTALSLLAQFAQAGTTQTSGSLTISDPAIAVNILSRLKENTGQCSGKSLKLYYPRLALPSPSPEPPSVAGAIQTWLLGFGAPSPPLSVESAIQTLLAERRAVEEDLQDQYETLLGLSKVPSNTSVPANINGNKNSANRNSNRSNSASSGNTSANSNSNTNTKTNTNTGGNNNGNSDGNGNKNTPDGNVPIKADAVSALEKSPEAIDFQAANTMFAQFIGSYFAKDQNGVMGIVSVEQGYQLYRLLQQPKGAWILYEEAIAGGGTTKDRKNLITNLFLGDLITYSGGVVITFALINSQDATIVMANTIRYRTPFTTIKKPTKRPGKDDREGDNLPE